MRSGSKRARALVVRLASPVQAPKSSDSIAISAGNGLFDAAASHDFRGSGRMSLSIAAVRAEHWRAIAPYAGAPARLDSRCQASAGRLSSSHAVPVHSSPASFSGPQSSSDRAPALLRAVSAPAAPPPSQAPQHRGYAQAALQPEYHPSFQQAWPAPTQPAPPPPQPAVQQPVQPFIKGTIHKIQFENRKNSYKVLKVRSPSTTLAVPRNPCSSLASLLLPHWLPSLSKRLSSSVAAPADP